MKPIALAQINTTVGAIKGNLRKIISYIKKAEEMGAGLIVFPELTITGYPPKDLLLSTDFIRDNMAALEEVVKLPKKIKVILGFVERRGKNIFNGASVIDQNALTIIEKIHLPNYDVFDEKRYFTPGKVIKVVKLTGYPPLGINICEDIWVKAGPVKRQIKEGAKMIINLSASPFFAGKTRIRYKLLSHIASENYVPVIYVNLIGGQDDLIFDGRSFVFNSLGKLVKMASPFKEELVIVTEEDFKAASLIFKENVISEIFEALVLGIRDYVRKNGFSKVVIGISGGIDSALVTVLAVEALGAENVVGIGLPSKITSNESMEDASKLASNLSIKFKVISIEDIFNSFLNSLSKEFANLPFDITEENLQSRIRGTLLMAYSNKFGHLVLNTGNKSEVAVGYCTLYGDMVGGLGVLSDVPKVMVYKLSRFINRFYGKEIIPKRIFTKPPTAELRPGQKDSDDLPSYEILDAIVNLYIEKNKSKSEIIKCGYPEKITEDIIKRIDKSEYKRRQAPPGLKITPKAFGPGRRMPLTNLYHLESQER